MLLLKLHQTTRNSAFKKSFGISETQCISCIVGLSEKQSEWFLSDSNFYAGRGLIIQTPRNVWQLLITPCVCGNERQLFQSSHTAQKGIVFKYVASELGWGNDLKNLTSGLFSVLCYHVISGACPKTVLLLNSYQTNSFQGMMSTGSRFAQDIVFLCS